MAYPISIARDRLTLPVTVFISTFILLAFVQLKVENPMLLAERFFRGPGWIEILIISGYGGIVAFYMQDPANVPKWRKITWEQARNLYLILTITIHASCMALARI
jgi:hypothetical protein